MGKLRGADRKSCLCQSRCLEAVIFKGASWGFKFTSPGAAIGILAGMAAVWVISRIYVAPLTIHCAFRRTDPARQRGAKSGRQRDIKTKGEIDMQKEDIY